MRRRDFIQIISNAIIALTIILLSFTHTQIGTATSNGYDLQVSSLYHQLTWKARNKASLDLIITALSLKLLYKLISHFLTYKISTWHNNKSIHWVPFNTLKTVYRKHIQLFKIFMFPPDGLLGYKSLSSTYCQHFTIYRFL